MSVRHHVTMPDQTRGGVTRLVWNEMHANGQAHRLSRYHLVHAQYKRTLHIHAKFRLIPAFRTLFFVTKQVLEPDATNLV